VAVAIAGFLAVTALLALAVYVPPHLIDTRGLDTEKRLKARTICARRWRRLWAARFC
jgi:hypothetical protein